MQPVNKREEGRKGKQPQSFREVQSVSVSPAEEPNSAFPLDCAAMFS